MDVLLAAAQTESPKPPWLAAYAATGTGAWTGSPATLGGGCWAATVHWCPASMTGELQAAVCCSEPACVAAVAMLDGACVPYLADLSHVF